MDVVKFHQVRKVYGSTVAVERVDLTLKAGTFVGLIGHNGAGKSTCLKMLMGLIQPTEGFIEIGGFDVHKQPKRARELYGAVPEEPALYPYLTAREFLEFVRDVRGSGDVDEVLPITGLGADSDRLIREYSQGMKRKTALAAALLSDTKLLILDEALNGLDPPSAAAVKEVLRRRVHAGATVLLSTHVIETVEQAADRVVMLAHGKVVADHLTADLPAGGLEELFLTTLKRTRDQRATPGR